MFSNTFSDSLILVVGRRDGDYRDSDYIHLSNTQIVDLTEQARSCPNLTEYPITPINSATGAIVSGHPMICGGWSELPDFVAYSECYRYKKDSNTWIFLTNMTEKRMRSASVVINGSLFVMGGFRGHSLGAQSSTEYISPDGYASQPGPELPSARYGHCAVMLSTGQVMLLGGQDLESKSVITFDHHTETFNTSLPPLKFDREHFGCAVFNSAMHENREVVLAVGGGIQATAEVWDYTQPNAEWTESNYSFLSACIVIVSFYWPRIFFLWVYSRTSLYMDRTTVNFF